MGDGERGYLLAGLAAVAGAAMGATFGWEAVLIGALVWMLVWALVKMVEVAGEDNDG